TQTATSSYGRPVTTPARVRPSRSRWTPRTYTCLTALPGCGSANNGSWPRRDTGRRPGPQGGMMRAVVGGKPGELKVTEVPDPGRGQGELVVQGGACGICGTDLHIANGEFPPTPYPIIPGHEFAGRVVAVGDGAPGEWRGGERVAVDPSLFCGHCPARHAGRGDLCANWNATRDTVNGAFAPARAV